MSSIDEPRPSPRRLRPRLLPFLLCCVVLTSGCVTTNLPPISAHGAAYRPLPDELDLFQAAREEESAMLAEVEVYDDPALERYLDQLVARLEPAGLAANPQVRFRVTVLEDPTFNAFAYPHGSIYIHSGLLAQAVFEDHIAAVLAHEMTHVENRHLARHERARWNRAVPIGALAIGISLALTVEAADAMEDCDFEEAEVLEEMADDVFFFGLELARRVSARGYGRRLEREADEGMLRKLRAHGYDVPEVLAFYEGLDGLADLGDSREVLAHGLGSDVARRLRRLSSDGETGPMAAGAPILAPPELARLLRGVVRDDVAFHLEAGNPGPAARQLAKVLDLAPQSPEARRLAERLAARPD